MILWKLYLLIMGQFVVALRTAIKFAVFLGDVFKAAKDKVQQAGKGISSAAKTIGNAASDAFKWIKARFQDAISFVKSLPSKFAAAGKAVGNAIKNGVKAGLSGLSGIVRSMAQAAIDALKEAVNSKIRTINSIIGVADSLTPGTIDRIPELAQGTSNFQGGMALVGEQGPELVNLPRGSKVFTASQTRQIAASGIGSAGAPEVRVFIGDRELTDIVRVEMREKDRAARANYRTGVV
jgi:phage-related protein